jgi:DNA-binding transcriptional regulator LsrR (DeoR family)
MLVVQEDSKYEPLVAAIKGGFASHLMVTASMAKRLLKRAKGAGLKQT